MLELGTGFAVEKHEHFFAGSQRLCNLCFQFLLSAWFGRLQSTDLPFRALGKLPRVHSASPAVWSWGGAGRGERVRECARLFKLFYYRVWETSSKGSPCGLLQYAQPSSNSPRPPEEGGWQDHRTRFSGLDFGRLCQLPEEWAGKKGKEPMRSPACPSKCVSRSRAANVLVSDLYFLNIIFFSRWLISSSNYIFNIV